MILHDVITTEKVPFRYRVAGIGSRFLAWLVDAVIIVLIGFIGVCLATWLEALRFGVGHAIMELWLFALSWLYFLLFEWLWRGQTPGKRLLGIRAIQWRGTSISFFQSAARNTVRFVDALPFFYAAGFLVMACNREQRRLGDLAAGTLVVHVERTGKPVRLLHESDAVVPPLQAQLRQRLGQLERQQKQLLLDLSLRKDQLRVGDRARLFRAASDFLQVRLDVSVAEFQSDEKFVLEMARELSESGPAPGRVETVGV
jgi:uncharacterized RDD family membrane protein YckC